MTPPVYTLDDLEWLTIAERDIDTIKEAARVLRRHSRMLPDQMPPQVPMSCSDGADLIEKVAGLLLCKQCGERLPVGTDRLCIDCSITYYRSRRVSAQSERIA